MGGQEELVDLLEGVAHGAIHDPLVPGLALLPDGGEGG